MSRHTPGPWSIRNRLWIAATRGNHKSEILFAPTYWMDNDPSEAEANSRLVHAAPDLFAIVETIDRLLGEGVPSALILDENSPTRDAIRDVIAKVRGGAT